MADDNPELEGPAPTPTEMDTTMPMEETPSSGGGGGTTLTVSVDALAQAGEDDQLETPQVGDKVQASIEGEVLSIEGGKAVVEVTHVNGEEVAEDEPEAAEEPGEEQQFNELKGMAANMPERY
jgi:hypothetical protein